MMNLDKKKIALYSILRVGFVVTYIVYATLYVGASLGRWNISHGLLSVLNTLSLLLYIIDFVIVVVMLVRLLRVKTLKKEYMGKALCIALGINLFVKIIMLLVWLNLVEIYSFELDLVYFILEACFVLTTIVLLNNLKTEN